MELRERVAKNIKKYRKAKGLTQEELGKMIGKSMVSIRKYEAFDNQVTVSISLDLIEKIANALKVETKDLLEPELKAEIFIENIEANITNYGTDEGNCQVVDGYTVNYEVANGYDSLNGSITIQEEDIEIESLKEKIAEKVKKILK